MFAYTVAVRVHIHLGDYKIEGANVLESTTTKPKRALINRSPQTIVRQAIIMMLGILGILVWSAMAMKRTPNRIVLATLKTTQQRIEARAIMMLDMKPTILVSQLQIYVATQQLMLQWVIKITQQRLVWPAMAM